MANEKWHLLSEKDIDNIYNAGGSCLPEELTERLLKGGITPQSEGLTEEDLLSLIRSAALLESIDYDKLSMDYKRQQAQLLVTLHAKLRAPAQGVVLSKDGARQIILMLGRIIDGGKFTHNDIDTALFMKRELEISSDVKARE